MTISISRGAYFKTEPASVTIPAGSSVPVKVIYQPNNMGAHSDVLRVRLFEKERELKVIDEPPKIRVEGSALAAGSKHSRGGSRGDAEVQAAEATQTCARLPLTHGSLGVQCFIAWVIEAL